MEALVPMAWKLKEFLSRIFSYTSTYKTDKPPRVDVSPMLSETVHMAVLHPGRGQWTGCRNRTRVWAYSCSMDYP